MIGEIDGRSFLGRYRGVPGTTTATPVRTSLPTVSDPEQAFANMSRDQYLDFVGNFSDYENTLIDRSRSDTSIIDAASEDAASSARIAGEVTARNAERYGSALTPVQQQEIERGIGRSTALGVSQAKGDARLAQEDANTSLMARLIDIGQGVSSSGQSGLLSAAQNQANLDNAYQGARASSRANTVNTIGQLGSAALLALAV